MAIDIPGGAQSQAGLVAEAVALHRRRAGARRIVAPLAIARLDVLDADQRHQRQRAVRDAIQQPEGIGVAGAHGIVGCRSRRESADIDQTAGHLVVTLHRLVAVDLVLVTPRAELQLVLPGAGGETGIQRELQALGLVLAVVVLDLDVVHVQRAIEPALVERRRRRAGVDGGNHPAHRLRVHAVELEPVARELVAIPQQVQPQLFAELETVARTVALVLVRHLVEGRESVAAVLVAVEIGVAEPQVGGLRGLLGVLQLHVQLLMEARALGRVQPRLGDVVLDLEAGVLVAAVDVVKTVGLVLHGLQQPAVLLGAGAVVAHHALFAVAADFGEHAPARLARDRGGDHVHRAADRERTVAHGLGALQHLDGGHAARRGEVIRGGIRVGSRGDQHAVFHQADLAAALGTGTADADVRPQAVALLFAHVQAGHGAQHPVDVGLGELPELRGIDRVGRAAQLACLGTLTHDADFLDHR